MTEARSPATIRDVAARAGVSTAAVSRFVNQKQRFTEEVEKRIAEAIEALGYRSNAVARSMVTGRSNAVAVLVAGLDSPHAAAVVKGICREAVAEGVDVLVVDTMHSPSPQAELERVMAMRVDGLVLAAPMPHGTAEVLTRYGRPFIDLNRREGEGGAGVGGGPEAGLAWAQVAAGALLGRYLLRSGHRRITYIGCEAEAAHAKRLQGLRDALAAEGVLLHVRMAHAPTAEGGAALASAVLLAAERPDAVVTCNDRVAMGLLSEARTLGVEVPRDVSVAGIENASFGRYLSPPLTSVELHADELAARAMGDLLSAIRGDPPGVATPLPEPRLVVRDSTRAVRG